MRTTERHQIEQTIKLLVILVSGLEMSPTTVAKTLGVSPAWLSDRIRRFRDAGLIVEYDRRLKRFEVDFTPEFQSGFLAKVTTHIRRAKEEKPRKARAMSVASPKHYTKQQFATYVGVTAQNVQNMIAGYGGQGLPEGWVAYRLSAKGRWLIQEMSTDPTGKRYHLPENIAKSAFDYKIGNHGELKVIGPKPVTFQSCCVMIGSEGCEEPVLAHSLCEKHYWPVLRYPETHGKELLQDLRSRRYHPKVVADIEQWVRGRKRAKGPKESR